MSETIGTYGILIDPSTAEKRVVHFPNGVVSLREMYEQLQCEIVECSRLGGGLELWVNEEGLIDGSFEVVGGFRVHDADGELLGQQMYAGMGLILTNTMTEDGMDTCGWTKERARAISQSLQITCVNGSYGALYV